jgi:hypothetical protein
MKLWVARYGTGLALSKSARSRPQEWSLPSCLGHHQGDFTMRILAIVLIVIGALILGYQGFTYVTRDKVVDAGPVQVTANREHSVWIPPVIGGVAVAAGLVILATNRKATA